MHGLVGRRSRDLVQKEVVPFFEEYCIRCHGPEKSKGQISLHTLDGDLSTGRELERWEDVLEMLESGEMPPEDEEQPSETKRMFIADWINSGLHDYVKKASEVEVATTTRRLTNFEYPLGKWPDALIRILNSPVLGQLFTPTVFLPTPGPW